LKRFSNLIGPQNMFEIIEFYINFILKNCLFHFSTITIFLESISAALFNFFAWTFYKYLLLTTSELVWFLLTICSLYSSILATKCPVLLYYCIVTLTLLLSFLLGLKLSTVSSCYYSDLNSGSSWNYGVYLGTLLT
jgi:hypothetical protein